MNKDGKTFEQNRDDRKGGKIKVKVMIQVPLSLHIFCKPMFMVYRYFVVQLTWNIIAFLVISIKLKAYVVHSTLLVM